MKKQSKSLPTASIGLGKSPFFLMGVVYRHFRNDAQRLLMADYNISTEMLKALEVIHHHEMITQQNLADILMNERSATKRLVDNLIKRDLIIAIKDENNLKNKLLSITASGEVTRDSGNLIMQSLEKKWLESLSSSEIESVKSICHKISANNIT